MSCDRIHMAAGMSSCHDQETSVSLAGYPRHVPCLPHHALGSGLLGWHAVGLAAWWDGGEHRPYDMPKGWSVL
jgi:hypothetical protein